MDHGSTERRNEARSSLLEAFSGGPKGSDSDSDSELTSSNMPAAFVVPLKEQGAPNQPPAHHTLLSETGPDLLQLPASLKPFYSHRDTSIGLDSGIELQQDEPSFQHPELAFAPQEGLSPSDGVGDESLNQSDHEVLSSQQQQSSHSQLQPKPSGDISEGRSSQDVQPTSSSAGHVTPPDRQENTDTSNLDPPSPPPQAEGQSLMELPSQSSVGDPTGGHLLEDRSSHKSHNPASATALPSCSDEFPQSSSVTTENPLPPNEADSVLSGGLPIPSGRSSEQPDGQLLAGSTLSSPQLSTAVAMASVVPLSLSQDSLPFSGSSEQPAEGFQVEEGSVVVDTPPDVNDVSSVASSASSFARLPIHMRPTRTSRRRRSGTDSSILGKAPKQGTTTGDESASSLPTCDHQSVTSRNDTPTTPVPSDDTGKYISTEARVTAANNLVSSSLRDVDLADLPASVRSLLQSAQSELEQSLLEKARLEGERDAVLEECQKAWEDRTQLRSRVATMEGQVAANTTARTPESRSSEIAQLKDKVGAISAKYQGIQQALEKERQLTDDLQRKLHKAQRMPLTPTHEDRSGKEDAVKKLQHKVHALASEMSDLQNDLNKSKEETSQLSHKEKLQASTVDSLEKANAWLSQQLDEGMEARDKLHQELHSAKSDKMSQKIELEQAKKEAAVQQQRVTELQRALLKDKAQLVRNLEAVEADVLSREDFYQNLTLQRQGLVEMMALKDAEFGTLDSMVADLKETVAGLELERDRTQQELGSAKEKIEDLKTENNNLLTKSVIPRSEPGEADAKDDHLAKLNTEVGSLRGRNQALEVHLKQKEAELSHAMQDTDLLEKEIESLKEGLTLAHVELSEAQQRISELEDRLERLNDSVTDSEEDYEAMKASHEALTAEVHQLRKKLASKEEQLTQRVLRSQATEDKVKELVGQLDALRTKYSRLEGGEDSYGPVLAASQGTIDQLKADIVALEVRVAQDSELMKTLKQNIGTLQQDKANLEGQLETFTQQSDIADEVSKVMKEKLALQGELREERMNGQKDMLKMQAKVNRLEHDLKAATKESAKLEKKLKKLQRDMSAEDQCDLKNLQAKVEDLSCKVVELEDERSLLNEALCEAEQTEAKNTSGKDGLKKENEILAEHLNKLASQLQLIDGVHQREVDCLRRRGEEQKRGLSRSLQEVTLELERTRGRLAGTMIRTQSAMRNHSAALEVALAEKESAICQLTAEVARLTEDGHSDRAAVEEKTAQLRKNLETASLQLERATAQLATQGEEAQTLRSSLSEQAQVVEGLMAQLSQAQDTDTDGDSRLANLSQANDRLQQECSSLRSQLSTQTSLVESFQREISDKGQQVDYFSRELQTFKMAAAEVQSEVEQLKEYYGVSEERRQADVDSLQKELDEVLVERNALRDTLCKSNQGPVLTSSPRQNISTSSLHSGIEQASFISSASLMESVDFPGENPSHSGGEEVSGLHERLERVEATNDELRQSGQETIGQALAYHQRLKQQERETRQRIADARRREKESADSSNSAEISTLKSELTHKHRSMDKLQSILSTLKRDMSGLQGQMDRHSQAVKASYVSSRQLEDKLEDLRKGSRVASPLN